MIYKEYTNLLMYFGLICLSCSCATINSNWSPSEDVRLELKKSDYVLTLNPLESPIYIFSASLVTEKPNVRVKKINYKAFSWQSKWVFENAINFDDSINSISHAIAHDNKSPFVLVENERNQFKYLFSYKKFNEPVSIEIGDREVKLIGPSRSMAFIDGLDYNTKRLKLQKEINYNLGIFKFYQYDLMINPDDKKIRLHYVNDKDVITSNWVDISERPEQIMELLNY